MSNKIQVYEAEKNAGLEDIIVANASIAYETPALSNPKLLVNNSKDIRDAILPEPFTKAAQDDPDIHHVYSILVSTTWNKNGSDLSRFAKFDMPCQGCSRTRCMAFPFVPIDCSEADIGFTFVSCHGPSWVRPLARNWVSSFWSGRGSTRVRIRPGSLPGCGQQGPGPDNPFNRWSDFGLDGVDLQILKRLANSTGVPFACKHFVICK